jgi:hypothetical protein
MRLAGYVINTGEREMHITNLKERNNSADQDMGRRILLK